MKGLVDSKIERRRYILIRCKKTTHAADVHYTVPTYSVRNSCPKRCCTLLCMCVQHVCCFAKYHHCPTNLKIIKSEESIHIEQKQGERG